MHIKRGKRKIPLLCKYLRSALKYERTKKKGFDIMFEIKGKYNTAVCFTDIVENDAVSQILTVCNEEAFADSKIRIMPDVHAGVGCTIGTTMTITDKAVPNMVGVDIGCGMYTVELGKVSIDLEELDKAAHFIPSGTNVWDHPAEAFNLSALRCFKHLTDVDRLERSLGTLGGGNHFIEVDEDDEGNRYLVIHSGSRNLGVQVAKFYQNIAISTNCGLDNEFAKRKLALIEEYKENGIAHKLQKALEELVKQHDSEKPKMPRELCYVTGSHLDDYLHDIEICQQFASSSRKKMAEILLDRTGLCSVGEFQTIHNYIDVDARVLRKGSVSAKEGEKLLIPINMRDGSLICIGKGNPDWNFSAPHGAGRLLSRSMAKQLLTMEEYRKQMEGIYTTCISTATLDEAPMAYKDMNEILENIRPTAHVERRIKPIYNFKASE